MKILETMVTYLRAAGRAGWPAISVATGVPLITLRKIAYSDAKNPTVETCQPIIDYIQAQKAAARKRKPPHAVNGAGRTPDPG